MRQSNIILVLAIFMIGCTSSGSGGSTLEDPFIGGTTGILIDFIEDSPPPEVYAGGDFPFDVVVKIENEGETKVSKEDIRVTLSGINAQEFGVTEADLTKNAPDDLEAKRKENGEIIESNPVFVEFIGLNREEDFSGNTYTIRADVCYKYATEAISKVCIRSNNLDNDEGVCVVNENKVIHNSGAPVQFENFRENARAKNKISFTFTVVHKGNGIVYKQDSDCGAESRRENEDKVWLEVDTGIEGLECSGLRDGTATAGFLTLYGGDKPVTCTQTVDTNSDYETTVELKVIYEYKDNAETSVFVKNSGP